MEEPVALYISSALLLLEPHIFGEKNTFGADGVASVVALAFGTVASVL
jgi:hypothetical protein